MSGLTMGDVERFEWTGYNTGELLSFLGRAGAGMEATAAFWLQVVAQHDHLTLWRRGDSISTADLS